MDSEESEDEVLQRMEGGQHKSQSQQLQKLKGTMLAAQMAGKVSLYQKLAMN